MWAPSPDRMPPPRLVAVAIDRDKGSQIALKWAVDNLLMKGQTVVLVHVRVRQPAAGFSSSPSIASSCNNLSVYMSLLCVHAVFGFHALMYLHQFSSPYHLCCFIS